MQWVCVCFPSGRMNIWHVTVSGSSVKPHLKSRHRPLHRSRDRQILLSLVTSTVVSCSMGFNQFCDHQLELPTFFMSKDSPHLLRREHPLQEPSSDFCKNIQIILRGLSRGSVVKIAYRFCRGPQFDSQHPFWCLRRSSWNSRPPRNQIALTSRGQAPARTHTQAHV